MTSVAADLLRSVEAQGGVIFTQGERLKVRAPRPLPATLIEQLRGNKPELLKLLRGTAWDGDDWQDWITERAAILEHDGELSRTEADRRAYEHALIEWLNRHPFQGDPGRCAGCGDPIQDQANDWRPLGDGAIVHYSGQWGLRCIERYGLDRRKEAAATLAQLGIGKTSK